MIKFICTASCIALAASVPAMAQEAQTQGVSEDGLDEIIVTANRRSESAQKSSLALEVLSSTALEQAAITRVADLQTLVPSLSSSSSGQNQSTYIRGVGSFSTSANDDSSIAYNINGVYISRPAGINATFFDLERVEVLKGPQGTLYGRNASGGAINLITRRPADSLEGYVSADYGNYDAVKLNLGIGGPVSDTFGVRAAMQYTKHDGYLTDGYNDQEDILARVTAQWKPSPVFSLLVVGEYAKSQGQGSAAAFRSLRQTNPTNPWTGPSLAPQPVAALIGPDRIRADGFVDTQVYAISAEANVDLGFATLTVLPAYRRTEPATLTYQPGFSFNIAETSSQKTVEVRLAQPDGALKWVLGGYYFNEDQTQKYTLLARPIQNNLNDTVLFNQSYAFFADANYSLSDSFRILGGIRYSHEQKGQDGFNGGVNNRGRRTDSDTSFRAGFEYDAAPDNMLFGTVATGFKAGGFFPGIRAPFNTYNPEKLTAYTIGSRNRFLDNRLQINLEGFYWKYRDKQERFLGALPGGTGVGLLTTNAGRATLYGANIDVVAKVGTGSLRLNAEYLHSKYDRFAYVVANVGPAAPLGYSALATGCQRGPLSILAATLATQTIDCSGKPLTHAPKWTGSVSFDQPIDLGGGTQLIPRAAMKFASSMWLSPDFIASGRDNGYASFDADLTLKMESGLSITGWMRNIGNQAIYSGGFRYPFSFHEAVVPIGDPTLFYADIRPPRTYGVTVRFDF